VSVRSGSFRRFLLVGASNTLVTYGLFIALAALVPVTAAYTTAFVAGLVLAYVLNTRFTFKSTGSLSRFLCFPLVYAVQYVYGLAGLHLLLSYVGLDKEYAMLVVIGSSIPITYFMTRLVLTFPGDPPLLPVRRRGEALSAARGR
jgi:putative flippase GtrA